MQYTVYRHHVYIAGNKTEKCTRFIIGKKYYRWCFRFNIPKTELVFPSYLYIQDQRHEYIYQRQI